VANRADEQQNETTERDEGAGIGTQNSAVFVQKLRAHVSCFLSHSGTKNASDDAHRVSFVDSDRVRIRDDLRHRVVESSLDSDAENFGNVGKEIEESFSGNVEKRRSGIEHDDGTRNESAADKVFVRRVHPFDTSHFAAVLVNDQIPNLRVSLLSFAHESKNVSGIDTGSEVYGSSRHDFDRSAASRMNENAFCSEENRSSGRM